MFACGTRSTQNSNNKNLWKKQWLLAEFCVVVEVVDSNITFWSLKFLQHVFSTKEKCLFNIFHHERKKLFEVDNFWVRLFYFANSVFFKVKVSFKIFHLHWQFLQSISHFAGEKLFFNGLKSPTILPFIPFCLGGSISVTKLIYVKNHSISTARDAKGVILNTVLL